VADDADIRIGIDASGVEPTLNNLRKAFSEFGRAVDLSSKDLNNAGKSFDKLTGNMVSKSPQIVRAAENNARAAKIEAEALAVRTKAYNDYLRAQGVAETKSGRMQSTSTGRLVPGTADLRASATMAAVAAEKQYRDALVTSSNAASQASQANAKWRSEEARQGREMFLLTQKLRAEQEQSARMAAVNSQKTWWPPGIVKATDAITRQFADMNNSVRYALYDVAGTAAIAGAAFLGFATLATMAAVAHERAFANVQRTTQTSARGYEILQRQLEELSMEIPVTYEELTKIATAAGQLGIQASGVENFTRTVAMLTATTNLTSEAAGNALARFKAFFATADDPSFAVTESTFTNLASSILKVGVNSVATESGIVSVATQISSMGSYAGLTADQVIGLAGALSSINVAPELSRGIITRLFTQIGKAVSDNGVQLDKFATVAGTSSAQFAEAWGTDKFGPLFVNMVRGLGEMQEGGGDAAQALGELGITSVRDVPVLLRLAGAADENGEKFGLFAQTMEDAREGWVNNIELALQYGKISQTTAARLQVLAQTFEQLFATMGSQSASGLGAVAGFLTDVVRGFEAVANTDMGQIVSTGIIGFTGLLGAALLFVSAIAGAIASVQALGSAMRSMTAEGIAGMGRLTAAIRIFSLGLGLVGIVGAIAAIAGTFVTMGINAASAKSPVSDMAGLLAAMEADAKRGADGIDFTSKAASGLTEEAKSTNAQAGAMAESLYGLDPAAKKAADAVDKVAAASEHAGYVFGQTAREFFKSQLAQSTGFAEQFDSDTDRQIAQMLNINWDSIIDESVKAGGDPGTAIFDQIDAALSKQAGRKVKLNDLLDASGTPGGKAMIEQVLGDLNAYDVDTWARNAVKAIGSSSGAIQAQIELQGQLGATTAGTIQGMVDGYEELDDATQKTVDSMAKGFAKFTDTGALIGLTQQMATIMNEDDAKAFETAWVDAYGGVGFSIDQYMGIFQHAADEQTSFVTDLQTLAQRGLDPAIIEDLAAMGPEANRLVEALVNTTDEQLTAFSDLWGRTGYETQLKFATSAAIAQHLVNAVFKQGGIEGLKAFNEGMATGIDVETLLRNAQLDINGAPLKPVVAPPNDLTWYQKSQWAQRNDLSIPVTPYLTKSTIEVAQEGRTVSRGTVRMFAGGGYTGDGGKYDPAGTVHRGEFVFDKESTSAIGVRQLYSMMKSARGGRLARGGRGYASGGFVGGGSGSGMLELSPTDRQLLRDIRDSVGVDVVIGSQAVAQATDTGNTRAQARGAA
jgi:TP901 family phage tail tape measure protein